MLLIMLRSEFIIYKKIIKNNGRKFRLICGGLFLKTSTAVEKPTGNLPKRKKKVGLTFLQ